MIDPITAGMIAGTASKAVEPMIEMGSYYLGDLVGYNDKLSKDQLEQYNKQLGIQQGYNLEAMQQQLKNQQSMYDYSYNKTTPAQQVKNLKEAGLNPAMALGTPSMGQGQTGSGAALGASSGGLESIASMRGKQAKQFELAQMMQVQNQIKATEAEIKLKESQAKNLDADTENKPITGRKLEAETNLLNIQSIDVSQAAKLKEVQADYWNTQSVIAKSTKDYEIDKANFNYLKTIEEYYQQVANTKLSKETVNTLINQSKANLSLTFAQICQINKNVQLTEAEIEKINNEIDLFFKEDGLYETEIAKYKSETNLKTREYKWTPVMNISKIINENANSVGKLMQGYGILSKFLGLVVK